MLSADTITTTDLSDNLNWSITNRQQKDKAAALTWLKRGIWLYFWLLLFEGALRKWVLPGLATPLLIVRDPLAIWLLLYGYQKKFLRVNIYMIVCWVTTAICFITTLLWGHGNFAVTVFGGRIMLFQFPLMLFIGQILSYQDVLKMGRALLWVVIPMTILMAVQFYSPQSAWVNRGVGGDTEGAGFSGALGYFRPPGTFSFTNGLTNFYGLATAFVFFFWFDSRKQIKKWLLIIASICLIAAIPLSISRSQLFGTALTAFFCLIIALRQPKQLKKIVIGIVGGAIILLLLGKTTFFQKSTEVFTSRFETANSIEGGVKGTFGDRFLGGFLGGFSQSANFPFWGAGMGMGTNAGAKLLTGKTDFLIAEGEWGRLLGESGTLLGLIFILLRLSTAINMLLQSFKKIRINNYLPWLLCSYGFLAIIQGQWGQPTSLGFAIFTGGIIMASLKAKTTAATKR